MASKISTGGGATEHILNMFGSFMDKQIAAHYMMQMVDEKLEKAAPQIAKMAADIVL